MANIFHSVYFWPKRSGNASFRVEWQDDNNLVRERFFNSYREAERFALEIERLLLTDAVQDICAVRAPHRLPRSKRRRS